MQEGFFVLFEICRLSVWFLFDIWCLLFGASPRMKGQSAHQF
jgi:hypothetical protein